MDLARIERIVAQVCDVVDAQGGDWDATQAVLLDTYVGEELVHALTYAAGFLLVYAEPDGPAFLRGMRDRRRRLVPPMQRRGWLRSTG